MFLLGKEGHTILWGETIWQIKGTIDDIASNLLLKVALWWSDTLENQSLRPKEGDAASIYAFDSCFQNRSKGLFVGLNLLDTPELIWNCGTFTGTACITPGHDRSIFQNRSKRPVSVQQIQSTYCVSGLNLLHTSELMLYWRTVTATGCKTPGNDGSTFQNRSKGPATCGLNLQHTPEKILNRRTVTAIVCIRQRIHLSESQQRPHLWREFAGHPWADLELRNFHRHSVHHPRSRLRYLHHKAKALTVAACCGWSTSAVRHSPSSISSSFKVCSKLTKTRFLAAISPLEKSTLLRCFFPKVCWAAVLNSWSVDEGRNVRSSACPFGKTACMIMWDILSWRLVKTPIMHLYLRLWARAKRCRTWKISWLVGWWLPFIKRFLYTFLKLGPSSKERRTLLQFQRFLVFALIIALEF